MVIAHTTSALLAAAGTSDSDFNGNATLFFVAILVPIAGLICTIVAIVLANRREPPVAEEMHKSFVPRAEYIDSVQRIHERIDKTSEDVAASRSQMSKAFGDLEHAIGRLEGKMDE